MAICARIISTIAHIIFIYPDNIAGVRFCCFYEHFTRYPGKMAGYSVTCHYSTSRAKRAPKNQ